MPGVGAGDVAHGALILENSFGDIARLRAAAAQTQIPWSGWLVWARAFRLPVVRGLFVCFHISACFLA